MSIKFCMNIGRNVGNVKNVVSEEAIRGHISKMWDMEAAQNAKILLSKRNPEETYVVSMEVSNYNNFDKASRLAKALVQDCIAALYTSDPANAGGDLCGPNVGRHGMFSLDKFITYEQAEKEVSMYGNPNRPKGTAGAMLTLNEKILELQRTVAGLAARVAELETRQKQELKAGWMSGAGSSAAEPKVEPPKQEFNVEFTTQELAAIKGVFGHMCGDSMSAAIWSKLSRAGVQG